MNKLAKVVALSLTLIISACGFQLRGSVTLPPGVEPIFISGINSSTQLSIELRNLLSAYGVGLTTVREDANYQLVIIEQKLDKRTAALGQGARVAEYQLIEEVSFELLNATGKTVLGPNKITERKIMPNNPNKVVSTSEEEKLLRREMLQNLAAKLARQLRIFDYQAAEDQH